MSESKKMSDYMIRSIAERVVKDLPHHDFTEEARELVQEHAVSLMPPKVRAVFDDPFTRDYLVRGSVHYNSLHSLGYIGLIKNADPDNDEGLEEEDDLQGMDETTHKKLMELQRRAKAQNERDQLRGQEIRALLKGFRTLKQARDALPQLTRYFEPAPPKVDQLPALSTDALMAQLVKDGLRV